MDLRACSMGMLKIDESEKIVSDYGSFSRIFCYEITQPSVGYWPKLSH
jgi:hypothetical protein